MKQSDLNHLRRLLGWIRCEIGQGLAELQQTMIDVAEGLGHPEIGPEAKARLVETYRRAEAIPLYVRDAVKALEKALAAGGRDRGVETARATAETRANIGLAPGAKNLQVMQEALRLMPPYEARRVAREADAVSGTVTPEHYVLSGAVEVLSKLCSPAADGWRLVPIEPTEAMEQAAADYLDACVKAWGLWRAMLDAAPSAPMASAPVATPKRAPVDDGICWSSKEIQRRQKEEDNARAAQAERQRRADELSYIARLRDALILARDSHGICLLTDPPQDAWKARGVNEVIRAALSAQPAEKPENSSPSLTPSPREATASGSQETGNSRIAAQAGQLARALDALERLTAECARADAQAAKELQRTFIYPDTLAAARRVLAAIRREGGTC
ncbi:hypothetical protein [Achromobacter insolitus]|uniref:hypothetical protein n=1 Tax=Achromobacter insolitus TaxID=217204 RepID=UPI000AE905C3|nr:hypothetical protein [Achromobacter insolitus]AVG40031.1 hypothetical protein MC81_11850 [Achromobacter insolitus]